MNSSLHLYPPAAQSSALRDGGSHLSEREKEREGENAGPQVSSYLKEEFSIKTWEIERCSLIKKTCHMYDEEWRIISNCQMKEPAIMEWIPDAVILGLRTSKVDENLIISMAKEAGIEKIYKSYIDEKNKLNALLIKNT